MNWNRSVLLLCAIFFVSKNVKANSWQASFNSIWDSVAKDYQTFYQPNTLSKLGWAFGGGAVLAHSGIDTEVQRFYQEQIHSEFTDDVSSVAKQFGEKIIMVPVSGLLALWHVEQPDSKMANWGQQVLRSYLLGGPIVGVTQPLTGGSRPRDAEHDAYWRPGNDDNGVSGHSFVGAVPFLVLAQQFEPGTWQRNLALGASGLSGWSRVNDDAHYLSQAMLGWTIAWLSVNAVTANGVNDEWYRVIPYAYAGGVGFAIEGQW